MAWLDPPQPHRSLIGLLLEVVFKPPLAGPGQMPRPTRERIRHLPGGGIGGMVHPVRTEQCGRRLLPQVAVPWQFNVVKAEGGQKRGAVRAHKVRVVAQTRIGRRNAFRVVKRSRRRRTEGVVDERLLQFVLEWRPVRSGPCEPERLHQPRSPRGRVLKTKSP